jgi:hypothetical protein
MERLLCGEEAEPTGKGGPGNAPILRKAASVFRQLAERYQTQAAELIGKAEVYEEWARSLLDPDPEPPRDDWDHPD